MQWSPRLWLAAMNNSTNPISWKFPLGTWFGVRVEVSLFFPLAVLYLCGKFGLAMGGTLSGLLFISVVLHEFGHIWGARASGGFGDEILIHPLGGLATVSPGNNTRAKLTTFASGPAVNLGLCLLLFAFIYNSPYLRNAFIPWRAPITEVEFAGQAMIDNVLLLGFHLNLLLFALNMLPACPLDGGQMLRTVFTASMGSSRGMTWSINSSYALAIVIGLIALLTSHVLVLVLAFMLILTAVLDFQRVQMGEYADESFMGYDFSQGYTSLEGRDESRPKRKPGVIARWRARREAERRRREEDAAIENELQLDAILAKLHEQGIGSLTQDEKRHLDRASLRYKDKGRDVE